ncbi:MAG: COX15/CtaA family protein [Flavobacteriales bacterium]|nr:COX15/CtaA family protein [Flavobacteriales bacterium]
MAITPVRSRYRLFRLLLKMSLALTFLVILAGSVVRTTGSGMGCPDWPKCFGQWIPPTDGSVLPADYREHYIGVRRQKNDRLADRLAPMGFSELAERIRNDHSIYEETDFVWQRTWTEYVNRLCGALLGLSLLATFVTSFMFWQKSRRVVWILLGVIILTVFQGWLGSVVVSTNLLPGTITVHMLFAFLIIAGLMQTYVKTSPGRRVMSSFAMKDTMRYAVGVLLVLTVVQVVLGTQVRQQVDLIAKELDMAQRELWIGRLGTVFLVHRSFSLLLLAGHLWLFYQVLRHLRHYFVVYRATAWLMAFILAEVVTGVLLAYLNMPRAAQPLHLLFSCMIVGAQSYLLFVFFSRRRIGSGSDVSVSS